MDILDDMGVSKLSAKVNYSFNYVTEYEFTLNMYNRTALLHCVITLHLRVTAFPTSDGIAWKLHFVQKGLGNTLLIQWVIVSFGLV